MTLGLNIPIGPETRRKTSRNKFSVISKSAITPFRSGRDTSIEFRNTPVHIVGCFSPLNHLHFFDQDGYYGWFIAAEFGFLLPPGYTLSPGQFRYHAKKMAWINYLSQVLYMEWLI